MSNHEGKLKGPHDAQLAGSLGTSWKSSPMKTPALRRHTMEMRWSADEWFRLKAQDQLPARKPKTDFYASQVTLDGGLDALLAGLEDGWCLACGELRHYAVGCPLQGEEELPTARKGKKHEREKPRCLQRERV
ncbi:UNVERIFIED_CONTAM: hypothetical protein FKN15_045356 [Acipenser sinensis]